MSLNTIMLVDDEPRLLAGIRRRLSGDFDIVTFERGADAIEYLSKPNDVKVIVADMQMPEMNGIELLKNVSEIAPKVRRLMLTGNSDQETAMAAINEGKVFRFIRKPCETAELKTIIDQAIEDYEFQTSDLGGLVEAAPAVPEKSEVQTNFLSVMNDELRTPLSQIITMSEVINRDAVTLDPQKLSGFLKEINKSGVYALRQVDRILEYTRLQSESAEVAETHQCDIVDVFNKAILAAKRDASEKLITFSIESLRKKASISAPRRSVELMVKELLDNAVKFSPFGGHVSVMMKYDKDRVAARISDDGTGLTTEFTETWKTQMQTPFQSQESDLKRPHSGLGLGLSLVRSISQKYDIHFDLKPMNSAGTAAVLVFNRAPIVPLAAETEPNLEEPTADIRLAS